ncbi:MAG: translation elongation factor Ts [Candidatus Falkowbacteria bacterium]
MEEIKLLRQRTGAGMVDCKKALDEAAGDIEKAIEILRKKGIAKAAKREARETREGLVKFVVSADGHQAVMVEFNAETDFVVRNDSFQKFIADVMDLAAMHWPKNIDQLLELPMADGNSIKSNLEVMSGVIGEKLAVSRMEYLSTNGSIGGYSHAGGKIGALVALDAADAGDLARDIAMQVAAANPRYLNPADVDAAEIETEKSVYAELLKKEGKPEAMLEKIMEGKLVKFYEGICLTKQEYIKDDKLKVEQLLGGKQIEKFIRFSL